MDTECHFITLIKLHLDWFLHQLLFCIICTSPGQSWTAICYNTQCEKACMKILWCITGLRACLHAAQHCISRWLVLIYMMEQVKPQHSFSSVTPVLVTKGDEVCWALDVILVSLVWPDGEREERDAVTSQSFGGFSENCQALVVHSYQNTRWNPFKESLVASLGINWFGIEYLSSRKGKIHLKICILSSFVQPYVV